MTKEQVRLALGAPAFINKELTYAEWAYPKHEPPVFVYITHDGRVQMVE